MAPISNKVKIRRVRGRQNSPRYGICPNTGFVFTSCSVDTRAPCSSFFRWYISDILTNSTSKLMGWKLLFVVDFLPQTKCLQPRHQPTISFLGVLDFLKADRVAKKGLHHTGCCGEPSRCDVSCRYTCIPSTEANSAPSKTPHRVLLLIPNVP